MNDLKNQLVKLEAGEEYFLLLPEDELANVVDLKVSAKIWIIPTSDGKVLDRKALMKQLEEYPNES